MIPGSALAAPGRTFDRRVRLLAAAASLLVAGWAGLVFAIPDVRFVVLTPRVKTGYEVTLALLGLFTALVLALFPDAGARDRLRWVALGFAVLGLGGLGFGYLLPLLRPAVILDTAMYGSLLTRSFAGLAMAIGLAPRRPRPLPGWAAGAAVGGFAVLGLGAALAAERLPSLTDVASLEAAATDSATLLHGLTTWHWVLSAVPLAAAIAAAVGATWHAPGRAPTGWLAVAMVLMAGSQLHTAFWPSAFSPILTTASLQRVAFTAAVALGGIFELRRVAAERGALLAAEREAVAQAAELARVRADFAAMIAHELASPLAAVRRSAELLATDALSPVQQRALATIEAEVGLLDALVADARAGASDERVDFAVHPFPVALDLLLADAVAYARTLPGDHPLSCDLAKAARIRVFADPERIAQVLHNLLHNAAKYSPPGAQVLLDATRTGRRVRIEVADCGPGIRPEEVSVVFARFGRGRDALVEGTEGTGLGLYLARRIVRAHGGDLRVTPAPGEGARFWFELEVVP